MAKFNVGDHVRVITKRFGDNQFHDIGVVDGVATDPGLNFRVDFSSNPDAHSPYNSYDAADLEHYIPLSLTDPEFDLDEIHQAEDLVNQRG